MLVIHSKAAKEGTCTKVKETSAGSQTMILPAGYVADNSTPNRPHNVKGSAADNPGTWQPCFNVTSQSQGMCARLSADCNPPADCCPFKANRQLSWLMQGTGRS